MDNKEVKRVLKDAKEAIKTKDFKTAIKLCKTVLKEDRNNYVALVLFGAALQDSGQLDEASKAFKKASEVMPDQPLAWQGLVSFYEKHDKNPSAEEDLMRAYARLIILESDISKKQDLTKKLSDLALKLQDPSQCSFVLARLSSDLKSEDTIRRCLVKALLQIQNRKDDDNVLICQALEYIITLWRENEKGKDYDVQDFHRQYLKYLYRSGDRKKVFYEAQLMAKTYSKDPYPLEWICKIWVEFVAEEQKLDFMKDVISGHVKELEALNSSSSAVNMAAGAISFCSGELLKAREELTQAVISKQAPWQVYLLLAETEMEFGCIDEACKLLADAKHLTKHIIEDQEFILLKCEAKVLSMSQDQEKLNKAIQICNKLLSKKKDDVNLNLIHAQASVSLKHFEEALEHLNVVDSSGLYSVKVTLLQARISYFSGRKEDATFVLESLAQESSDGEVWLDLAKVHEEGGKKPDDVLTDLIQAARCKPYLWETFMLLGKNYKRLGSPVALDKARRCFQKALQLNPKSLEVGEHLSDVLLLLHDVENNIQLLDMIKTTSNSKWVWLRLGLLHTECGEIDKAITYLCNAVRSDPLDCRIWESLGDAYMMRGAWHAAFKSFSKVMQLSPTNIYALFQIGTVKLRMKEYEEALLAFRELLKLSDNYVPGLEGQGEAAFCLAQALQQQHRLGCARDRCQEAIDALTRVLKQRRDLSCTWKLLGDACLLGARLPASYSSFHIAEWLVSDSTNVDSVESHTTTMLRKRDLFILAERLFCRAMSINHDNSFLWHDLASANFWHAMDLPQSQKRTEILQRAMTAAHRAVTLRPENASHWNILGVIAASEDIRKLALAQHALIQAISLDGSNALAWTNLGTLYLIVGDISLANKAFSAAQRSNHEYTSCWLGQAMIAEAMAHGETVDLFRHAATLEYHSESCAGYAHWVLTTLLENESVQESVTVHQDTTLKDLKNMHGVEIASDCMKWYTECCSTNVCGWNMLGLLLERQKLFRGAHTAFQKGLEEAVLQGCGTNEMDAIRCNLGRVLTNLHHYDAAIEIFQKVTKASFASQSGLALAFFKAQRFEEAYEAYSTALEWLAPNNETKALILMAMASMQYSFNQLEDCKVLLFQSIQPKPLSAHPLLALCAIGLLHQDIPMSKIMLKELSHFKDDPRFLALIGLLEAYTFFLQGDQKGAVISLSKAVHRHPGNSSLWLSLAHVQMHAYPKCDAVAIGRTAHAALLLGRASMDVSKVQAVVSVAHLLSGRLSSAATNSQKAVHQFPNVAENWSTLVASLLPHNQDPKKAAWLRDLISYTRRRLQPSSGGLKKWLGNLEHHLTSLSLE